MVSARTLASQAGVRQPDRCDAVFLAQIRSAQASPTHSFPSQAATWNTSKFGRSICRYSPRTVKGLPPLPTPRVIHLPPGAGRTPSAFPDIALQRPTISNAGQDWSTLQRSVPPEP